jgi:hypothetical protein
MTEEEIKQPPKIKGYQPKGNQYLDGMPKRFLKPQEWRALPKERRELALQLGLYEVIYD